MPSRDSKRARDNGLNLLKMKYSEASLEMASECPIPNDCHELPSYGEPRYSTANYIIRRDSRSELISAGRMFQQPIPRSTHQISPGRVLFILSFHGIENFEPFQRALIALSQN